MVDRWSAFSHGNGDSGAAERQRGGREVFLYVLDGRSWAIALELARELFDTEIAGANARAYVFTLSPRIYLKMIIIFATNESASLLSMFRFISKYQHYKN